MLRKTTIITYCLVSFFVAPAQPLLSMDSVADLPLSDEGAGFSYKDMGALKRFPRIIYDRCVEKKNNFTAAFVSVARKLDEGIDVGGYEVAHYARNICNDLRLSPQTAFTVISTCKAIAEKQPVDPAALAIIHDPVKELESTRLLIRKMPRILSDICNEDPYGRHAQKLTRLIFSIDPNVLYMIDGVIGGIVQLESSLFGNPKEDFQEEVIREIDFHVYGLLKDFSGPFNLLSLMYVSPQTVAQMAQEFCGYVFQKERVSCRSYDRILECSKGFTILKRFPSELMYYIERYHSEPTVELELTHPSVKRLIAAAYFLEQRSQAVKYLVYNAMETPGKEMNELPLNQEIKQLIESVIRSRDEIKVCALTNRFIAAFTPAEVPQLMSSQSAIIKSDPALMFQARTVVTDCYDTILKNCLIKNLVLRTMLMPSFEKLYMKLATVALYGDTHEVDKLCDTQYVIKQLEETLPTCFVCLKFFSDQFAQGANGKKHVLKPCYHVLCKVCLQSIKTTCYVQQRQSTCPLCRKEINDDDEALS